MLNPLISILVPVFNRENIIKDTLDSILSQSYTLWECILVDDHSTDKTLKTINTYVLKDSRFKVFKRLETLPKGANACRNYAFTMAKGDYVNWFDSDDIMMPNFLDDKIKALKKDSDAVIHRNRYSNYDLTRFRASKFEYTTSDNLFYNYALDQIELQTSVFLWKKSYLENKALFDESMQRFQDTEFHARMLILKPNSVILDKVLATIRGGDGDDSQISSKTNLNKRKLYDIFYYRYQVFQLSSALDEKQHHEVAAVNAKKALWSFYDMLRFEKKFNQRLNDVKAHKNKLKSIYLSQEFNVMQKLKSKTFIALLILFGSSKYK